MMKPDLVVGWFSTFQPKVLRSTGFWHGRGIRTFIAPASIPTVPRKTVEMEYESILQMGRIFQKEKQAQALVEGMRRTIADVTGRARTAGLHRRGLILELAGRNLVVYGEKLWLEISCSRREGNSWPRRNGKSGWNGYWS